MAGIQSNRYLDIRTYTELTDKPEKVATKRGITLRPDLVGQLCAGSKRYNYKYLTVWGRGGAGKPHAGSVASGNKRLYGKVLGKNA